MKKKLFTLMMLLVCIGGGKIWGDTYKRIISSNAEAGYYTAQDPSHTYDDGITWSFSAKAAGTATINSSANKYPKFTSESTLTISGISGTVTEIKIWAGLGSSTATIPSSVKVGEESFTTEATTFVYKNNFSAETSYITYTGSGVAGNITITLPEFSNGIYFAGVEVTYTGNAIASQTFAGVKVDGSALTANSSTNGYTVASTTIITLSDDIQYLTAPTDITLTNHITFTDKSTVDDDVDVTFDGTVTDGYFTGTATIGETVYTVKVKKDVTPTIALSSATGTISLKSYEATGTAKVTLTGANLANGTFNAPTASGVTVTPATVDITDGTIDQEFTITPSATTAAETVLAFAYTGATTQNYTLNYSKTAQRSVTQTTVSEATTWDWTYAGDETIQLNENTSPTNEDEFVMADIEEVNNTSQFKSQALKVVCQFPTRGTNHYLQGNSVKFMTTVPGTVQVYFSNTSTREDNATNRRYLYINGVNSGVYTLNQSFENTSMAVPVGEVVINAYTGEETPAATMVRINKIVFTPIEGDVVEVTTAAYATHVLADDIDFTATSDVKAYAAKVEGDKITLTEVSAAPKGTPLVIAATKDVYTLTKAATTPAAVTDNDLVAGPVTGDGSSYYVLGKDADGKLGFGLLASGSTLPGTKAYIPASKFTSAPSFAYFDGETTGVSEVRSQKEDVRGEYFNLNGQRVAQPTKGLYIVNGRKVVVK